jgi:hypothetical protein
MSHLSTERLAELADEQPTLDERAHIAQCSACHADVEAYRSLRSLAGSQQPPAAMPLTRWETLVPRLRAEGLLPAARGRGLAVAGGGYGWSPRSALRIAAGLMLMAGGAALGRLSAGATPIPGVPVASDTASSVAERPPEGMPVTFSSVQEAAQWKSFYADAYQSAVSFLAANDSSARPTGTPAVIRARLSALDRVSRTMQEALRDAPYDPVINDFYLNSFGQREATLRQLNTVLPQPVRLNTF